MWIVMVGEVIEGVNNSISMSNNDNKVVPIKKKKLIQKSNYYDIFSLTNGELVRGKKCTFDSKDYKGAAGSHIKGVWEQRGQFFAVLLQRGGDVDAGRVP